jgi:hypothetical protein
MRWEDAIKKNVKQIGAGSNWKNLALDKEGWKLGCETG